MKLKRTKWKRMTAILGFVLFVLCLTAFGTTEVRADDPNVWIAGVNTNEVQSGEGWTYDPVTHTLTVEDYSWTYTHQETSAHSGWIGAKGVTLTICLKGENRIMVEGTDQVNIIFGDNDIIITGDGSLEIVAESGVDTTIYSQKNLTVKSGTLKLGQLYAEGTLSIEGGIVNVDYHANDGFGALNGNTRVQISGGEVYAKGDFKAITGGRLSISGGLIEAKAGISLNGAVVIHGGSVSVVSGAETGIYAGEDVEITAGSVDVTSDFEGICAGESVDISGGVLIISSGTDGIQAVKCAKVTGGTVAITSGGRGIYAEESVGISGGTLTISSRFEGIKVYERAEITDGTVTITSEGDGISSEGSVDITDGSITVTSVYIGIHAEESVSISGGIYRFSTTDGAAVACVYVENGSYTFAPGVMSADDGFLAMGTVNGKQVLFPINYNVIWNTVQENALNALCEKYGVDNWDELFNSIAFIRDTSGRSVQKVMSVGVVGIEKMSGVDLSQGVEITFPASGITAKDDIIVFHLTEDGVMECITAKAGDGVITATFTSLSPVYYFKVENAGNGTNSGEGTDAGNGTYEPSEIVFIGEDGKAMRWLSSEKDGNISISGSQTSIPAGAVFKAKRLYQGADYKEIAEAVANAKGGVSFEVYEFSLFANGREITSFDSHVDVSMLLPSAFDLSDGQTVTVYHYNNGKLEKCSTAVADGFVTFATTHFSTFVYVQESAAMAASSSVRSPKTGENSTAFYAVMIAVAAFGMTVYGKRAAKKVN